MAQFILNTSYKHHLIVGLIISIWLVGFLFLVHPFDLAEIPLVARLQIIPIYGVIAFLSYMLLIPLQNALFKNRNTWKISFELGFIVLYNVSVLFVNNLYYRSSLVNGDNDFVTFALQIYYPIFLILLPILLFSRWYLNKKLISQESNRIMLRGENKMDLLHLSYSDIVCISSSENYVEVSYLVDYKLHKKLLRTTLKKIHEQLPALMKTHRSYLINPAHIQEWKNSKTLLLTKKEVPVSKNYREAVLSLEHQKQS